LPPDGDHHRAGGDVAYVMNQAACSFRNRRPGLLMAGFSLVELMVSIALGLLIVLAMVTLLINVNRNNGEMSRTNSVIENGRFTMQLLETDLSHAGFWSGFLPTFDDLSLETTPTDTVTAIPDPCLAYASWTAVYKSQLIGTPLQVYEVSSAGSAPTVGTCASSLISSPKASTHVLFVRHAAPCDASATGTDEDCTAAAGDLYFQYGRCGTTPAPGYLITAAADDALSNFTLMNRNCNAAATARSFAITDRAPAYKYVQHMYYVRNYSVSAGDGIPTLMRTRFYLSGGTLQTDTQALIEGVEGFRVELGMDDVSKPAVAGGVGTPLTSTSFTTSVTWADLANRVTPTNRGDGTPDHFKQCTAGTACTAFELMNVVSAKLYVLVRANSKSAGFVDGKTYNLGSGTGAITLGPFNDAYKRHLYTQSVRLTNISMRREVPPP
jgi:type IV pilus assembly protein PilW